MDLSTARWRKSSRSDATNTCVEVALVGTAAGVRDSKNPTGPILILPTESFANLLHSM